MLRRDAMPARDDATTNAVALHYWPPLRRGAAFGIVMTTERFSFVRYFFATRCTSAAVTFRIWSRARVDQVRDC